MQPFEFKATLLSLSLISAVTAAGAAGSVFSSSEQAAEKAYDQHQYKKAETSLLKALDAASTEGTRDLDVARARVLLSKVYRESARPQKASEQLVLALTIYKKLGFAEPVFADERNQLFKEYKQVDPGTLGQGYDALKNNSAVISIQKKDAGAHVEFTMPAPMEKTLNSQKVDGLQLEAVVSFDLATTSDGKVHASNIKGFKIHSVEKNTWANLLDLTVGGPANSEGTYDATIIAGKGGFTKTVAAKLPEKAYQPVRTIADQIEKFDGAPTLDIPIAAAPAEVAPTAAPVSTPTVTAAPVEAPTLSTPPVSSPTLSTPTVTTAPVDAPSVSTPSSTVSTAPSWRETKVKSKKPLSNPAVETPVTTSIVTPAVTTTTVTPPVTTSTVMPAVTTTTATPPVTTTTIIEPASTPISTSTPEVFSPKTESRTTTSEVSAPKTETTTSTTTVISPTPSNVEPTKVKSKHDDDDDDDDKEDAARRQRRREERRARHAAEDAKEAAEDAAEKLDDAKKRDAEREKERAKDKDKDDSGDKNDKDRKDKD